MKNKGISLLSMVIYVALFFAFMSFATIMATNMDYTSLSYKGKVIGYKNFEKWQANMIVSAKQSNRIDRIQNRMVFSNGDVYEYDAEEKMIRKNDADFFPNVTGFRWIEIEELTGIPVSMKEKKEGIYGQIEDGKDYLAIEITFEKYGGTQNFQLFVVAGEDR